MPKASGSRPNRQILEEASDWFVDFRVGDVDAAARERFDEWLRRSPEHIRAYWEIAKTYVDLPSPSDMGQVDVGALIAYAHSRDNVMPLHAATRVETPAVTVSEPHRRTVSGPARRRRLAVAAACALMAAVVISLWWNLHHYPVYTTDIGERRSLTLPDGSTVDLNARSRIRIEFSTTERRVDLLDGQALFQVTKDGQRPFIVSSSDATVRAVGTQFDVYRKSSGTIVTVLEGRVAVYSNVSASTGLAATRLAAPPERSVRHSSGAAPARPVLPTDLVDPSIGGGVLLSAGEQVTVTPQAIAEAKLADLNAATAWMQRRLTFDGSKLSDVAAEFNRYNRRQLVIDGGELSDFHVSGVYSSTDPTSLLRFLREQPGIRISETETEVHIARQ